MAIVLLPLTPKQEAVLAFLWNFFEVNDQLPPSQLICEAFGWKSKNAAAEMLAAIGNKGFIEKNAVGKYRFSELFHAEQRQKRDAEEAED